MKRPKKTKNLAAMALSSKIFNKKVIKSKKTYDRKKQEKHD